MPQPLTYLATAKKFNEVYKVFLPDSTEAAFALNLCKWILLMDPIIHLDFTFQLANVVCVKVNRK